MCLHTLVLACLTCNGHGLRTPKASDFDSNVLHQELRPNGPAAFLSALNAFAALLLDFNSQAAALHATNHNCNPAVTKISSSFAAVDPASPIRRNGNLQMMEDDGDEAPPSVPKFTRIPIPVGPLCPFRSEAASDGGTLSGSYDKMASMPNFATDYARLMLELQAGGDVDKARVAKMADDLTRAVDAWRVMVARMRLTTDFQVMEFFKLTEAWTIRKGSSVDNVGAMMDWQADNLRAFANNRPPRPPPPGIDISKFEGSGGPALNVMGAANAIDAPAFTGGEEVFKSDVISTEWEQLSEDHAKLIKIGEGYGKLDREDKIDFINKIEEVEGRWDTFYSRFSLLGVINPEFEQQTSDFFEEMGMSNIEFRELLAEAHDRMRKDASRDYRASLGGFF